MPWKSHSRRLLALCLGLLPVFAAQAQDSYPSKYVTIVAALPVGGDLDLAARLLAESFTKQMKQSFVVENRAGAGGLIGMQRVATAVPDGYTISLAYPAAITLAPQLKLKPPYDPRRDFTAIGQLAVTSNALLVPSNSKIRTIADLIAAAKAHPGKLNFGSWGIGSGGHLAGAMLNHAAGVQTEHIVYRGTVETQTALESGELDFAFLSYGPAARSAASGRTRVLAVLGKERNPLFPDAPTMEEAGIPILQQAWFGLVGPKGLPPQVVTRLEAALAVAAKDPKLVKTLADIGITASASSATQFDATIKQDYVEWGKAAQLANIPKD